MGAAGTAGTADDDANSDDDWKTAEGPRGGGEVIAEDLELEELYAEPERTRAVGVGRGLCVAKSEEELDLELAVGVRQALESESQEKSAPLP